MLSTAALQELEKRKNLSKDIDGNAVGDRHKNARNSASTASLVAGSPSSFNIEMDAYGEEELKMVSNLPSLFREDFGGDLDDGDDTRSSNNSGQTKSGSGKAGAQLKRQRGNSPPRHVEKPGATAGRGGKADGGKGPTGSGDPAAMLPKRKLLEGLPPGIHVDVGGGGGGAPDGCEGVAAAQALTSSQKALGVHEIPRRQCQPLRWTAVTENTR